MNTENEEINALRDICIQLNNIYLELDRMNNKRWLYFIKYVLPTITSIVTSVLVSLIMINHLLK